jgi:pseudaminic acid synthase
MKEIQFGSIRIGGDQPPLIVPEMSGNHNGDIQRALALVDAAAAAGAKCIKLQTYTADSITIDSKEPDFLIRDPKSPWDGANLYELYQRAHTPWDWHEALFRRAKEKGLMCFSTPFDEKAVDLLEELGAPCYKIASFENNHFQLIRKVAKTGKPVIVSTGVANLDDLYALVECLRENKVKDFVLLKCTSAYPANPADSHLRTIPHLRELFQCPVGLSDHTLGIGSAIASVALGAVLVEKHFTLDRADGGVDSSFSLDPAELKLLIEESQRAFASMGGVRYQLTEAEKGSLTFRRSIYVTRDIRKGDSFSLDNVRVIRPGFGLPPRYLPMVLEGKAASDLKRGTALQLKHLHLT